MALKCEWVRSYGHGREGVEIRERRSNEMKGGKASCLARLGHGKHVPLLQNIHPHRRYRTVHLL